MSEVSQPGFTAPTTAALKGRIVTFMQGASTEITPSEQSRLAELQCILAAGTSIYVAHTPNACFDEVIDAAVAVQEAGFFAVPHIAVRRIADSHGLRAGLARLERAGIDRILLIGGDAARPVGEFSSTLDVLQSQLLKDSGITRVAVAGHPQGHNAVPGAALWAALEAKQEWAARAGVDMYVVTQFGLSTTALKAWERELALHKIRLGVRVGIAGPASLAKLAHFALQCGIGASMRALMRNLSAAAHAPELATTPDQHLLSLMSAPTAAQVVAPHFFAFGGALQTARWMRQISNAAFEIDAELSRFTLPS
jgi:methylenetetrahydrofolate reductase (NADPH)